ncbi:MAG TPA: helix-turn-helix domain-containing protein [Candidatus Limnocylindria bacterium]|nr:helix-turn-helix domain-containing protein [Candidatus Limnocylindria bacterium]
MKKTAQRGLQLGAERVVNLFVNKWTIKIIHALARADRRHGEMRRLLAPVSQKVLTRTLRDLENSGLVQREIASLKPLHVRYSLTSLGRSFVRPLNELCNWATEHEKGLNEVLHRRRALRKNPPKGVVQGLRASGAPWAGQAVPTE